MIVLLNLFCILVGIVLFINAIKCFVSGNRNIFLITFFVFEIEYIFPLIVETIWFILQLKIKMFPAMDYALCDKATGYLYFCFAFIVQCLLYYLGKKKYININSLELPYLNPYLFFIIKVFRFLPVFTVIFAPEPLIYVTKYAPFVFQDTDYSERVLLYHSKVLLTSTAIAFLATLFVQLFRKKTNKKQMFVQYLAILVYCFLNGKRTIFAFSIMGVIFINILKTNKINLKKIVFELAFVIAFFITYSLFSGKGGNFGSGIMNIMMNYIMYFDRAFVTKIAIFNKLNPELVHILDYTGQTILFDLFFWIPRGFWSNKPYPYAVYFTSGVVGNREFSMVSWRFQTSVYAEWISNFNIIGLFVLFIVYIWFVYKSESKKNFLIYFLALMFSCFLQVFEFTGTPQYFLLLWLALMLLSMFDKQYFKSYRQINS